MNQFMSMITRFLSVFPCLAIYFLSLLHASAEETSISTKTLDVNDVSWLFPPPKDVGEIANLIDITSLKDRDGNPVWTENAFKNLLKITDGPESLVQGNSRIKLPPAARIQSSWKIVAFRVDPSAPGTSESIREKFGSAPQIRLTLQPVEDAGGRVRVHDITVHLLFNFVNGMKRVDEASFPILIPDNVAFQAIVDDLVSLKGDCAKGGVVTSGVSLQIHPGLNQPDKVPDLRSNLRAFFERHLSDRRLRAMAIMGLPAPAPEPWIFVAIQRLGDGSYAPVSSPGVADPKVTAQMLSFLAGAQVLPEPSVNNLNQTTGALFVPPPERRGVSTAPLFENGVQAANRTVVGQNSSGKPIIDEKITNGDLADIVAHPVMSHFFNTDCVSCHTETTRREILKLPTTTFAFPLPKGVSGVSQTVIPKSQWNVRNFGWFQSSGSTPIVPTVTQRTANETAEVVEFINHNFNVNGQ